MILALFALAVRAGTPVIAAERVSDSLRFAPQFLALAPWIAGMFAASIAVGVAVLGRGRWNPWLRACDVALGAYTAAVLVRVLATPSILLSEGLSTLIKLGVALVTVVVVFETVGQLWRLIQPLLPAPGRLPRAVL
jgi:hypothetical protein